MNIDLIKDVRMYSGIITPRGESYIPSSLDELDQIKNKIMSHGFTGNSVSWGSTDTPSASEMSSFRENCCFISFRLMNEAPIEKASPPGGVFSSPETYQENLHEWSNGKAYYIDMKTVYLDIRENKLNQLI